MSPIGSRVRTLGPQLVALFGKTVEPLGGTDLMEEVGHFGQAWRFKASSTSCNLSASLL